ncbi:PKD domain-containing protein [Actinokineospora terrae]|uniref:PKD domain-containing protein n=1 Tax=Actinokineospora terrae TaxID=155974 RepID=A0A1H9MRW9_9PSEU|nr:PKD domain-containing protein [Actinokineospora terrae]SER26454.1 PKD domain-containing protein [Actinokineospora terrae]
MRLSWCKAVVVAVGLALAVPGVAEAAPPSNDDFGGATAITAFPYAGPVTFTEATTAPDDPWICSSNNERSVWFDFTPTADGVVQIGLTGYGYGMLTVFTGTRGALTAVPNTCRTSNYDANLVPVVGGTTYHVMVISPLWSNANLALTIDNVQPPANDNFANAAPITTVPAAAEVALGAATAEPTEPNPSCVQQTGAPSAWYSFTAPRTEWITFDQTSDDYESVFAVYTGNSLGSLTEVLCDAYNRRVLAVTAGQTYRVQVSNRIPAAIPTRIELAVAPALRTEIGQQPLDPSVLDTVTFSQYTWDIENEAITGSTWTFGDGTTASGREVTHQFAADGDYQVRVTTTSASGRVATATRAVAVRTHDVRVAAFTVPTAGRPGQTKPIEVTVGNTRIAENATVTLFRSTSTGFQEIARATQYVPARPNRTVTFPFNYTFTPGDATLGRVTFRAVVTLDQGVRDVRPVDNEAVAPATTVRTGPNGLG